VPVGAAAIEVKSLAYAHENIPVETAYDVYHPGRYQYTVVLTR
jgi:hypothetical protein